jgi:phosphoribosylanthranilate isomerase
MIRVKICGMTSVGDVRTSAAAGADALGFIFASSPRRLSVIEARVLTDAAPSTITTVGVFANDPADLVRVAIAQCRLDVLQFSGDESADYCGSFGKPTIVVSRSRSLSTAELDASRAIAILVDARTPGLYGGTGKTVDPETFARVRAEHPGARAILAGGLTPANVAQLVDLFRPDAVDVRTGVEREGRKDPALVRTFVTAAHEALGPV